MPSKKKLNSDQKKLMRRYLVWCYKSTKETLDRVDRKVTQLMVDYYMLEYLQTAERTAKKGKSRSFAAPLKEFKEYIGNKENQKSVSTSVGKITPQSPEYFYLHHRLTAIEKAICHFLGKKELTAIKGLYEQEMTNRILEAREHT